MGQLVVTDLGAAWIGAGVLYANGGPEALLSAVSNQPTPTPREPAPNQAVKTAGGDCTAGRKESYVLSEA